MKIIHKNNQIEKHIVIYNKYIDTCINLENRRETINSWILLAVGAILSSIIIIKTDLVYLLITSFGLLFICYFWWKYITYLKIVIKVKYKVIDKLEKEIGFTANALEWEYLKKMSTSKMTGANYQKNIILTIAVMIITSTLIKLYLLYLSS